MFSFRQNDSLERVEMHFEFIKINIYQIINRMYVEIPQKRLICHSHEPSDEKFSKFGNHIVNRGRSTDQASVTMTFLCEPYGEKILFRSKYVYVHDKLSYQSSWYCNISLYLLNNKYMFDDNKKPCVSLTLELGLRLLQASSTYTNNLQNILSFLVSLIHNDIPTLLLPPQYQQ